jgi:hypothetical protein
VPRELGDVLHYFIPELEEGSEATDPSAPALAVPLLGRDVVRASLLWNLAVEAARQGARATLVAAAAGADAPWPSAGLQPLGVDVIEVAGDEPSALARSAEAAAQSAAAARTGPSLVLAGVPAPWLAKGADAGSLLRWVVALVRPEESESQETWSVLEAVAVQAPRARLGAAIFGVRSLAEARRTFERLAARVERELSRTLASYGVLIDDVELSRSIVTRRPIALVHPASAAARALADVASLCLADASERSAPGPSTRGAGVPGAGLGPSFG